MGRTRMKRGQTLPLIFRKSNFYNETTKYHLSVQGPYPQSQACYICE